MLNQHFHRIMLMFQDILDHQTIERLKAGQISRQKLTELAFALERKFWHVAIENKIEGAQMYEPKHLANIKYNYLEALQQIHEIYDLISDTFKKSQNNEDIIEIQREIKDLALNIAAEMRSVEDRRNALRQLKITRSLLAGSLISLTLSVFAIILSLFG